MGIDPELIETFGQSMSALFDARTRACSYYSSREYDEIHEKLQELNWRLKRKLGKKKYHQLWEEFYGLSDLHGQEMAALQESSYRRGFNDALFLIGEINRAQQGLPNIFSGQEI